MRSKLGRRLEFALRKKHPALIPVVIARMDDADVALDYPARYLFTFLEHHGMLTVTGSPTWRTVVGGSRSYVDRVRTRQVERGATVRTAAPVVAVSRHHDGVDVRTGDDAVTTYDKVVVATHADQALALLADATPQEKEDLAAIRYTRNATVLHRDTRHLPTARRARASWNYRSTTPACRDS